MGKTFLVPLEEGEFRLMGDSYVALPFGETQVVIIPTYRVKEDTNLRLSVDGPIKCNSGATRTFVNGRWDNDPSEPKFTFQELLEIDCLEKEQLRQEIADLKRVIAELTS